MLWKKSKLNLKPCPGLDLHICDANKLSLFVCQKETEHTAVEKCTQAELPKQVCDHAEPLPQIKPRQVGLERLSNIRTGAGSGI